MSEAAVIHDIGYRRYEGPRLGRGYAALSLYVHSLRTAFGIGRGTKAKIFPWAVVSLIGLIAAIITAITASIDERVVSYTAFTDNVGMLAMLFIAVAAPELVSRDLRARVLVLYFSRPLRRSDYILVKLAALMTAVFALLGAPQLVLFAGAAFEVSDVGDFLAEFGDLLAGLGYAAVFAAVTAAVALPIAAVTGKRAFAAGGIVAFFLVTFPIAGVLSVVGDGAVAKLAGIVNPTLLVQGVGQWLFDNDGIDLDIGGYGPLYGLVSLAVIAGCTGLLLLRYRKVES